MQAKKVGGGSAAAAKGGARSVKKTSKKAPKKAISKAQTDAKLSKDIKTIEKKLAKAREEYYDLLDLHAGYKALERLEKNGYKTVPAKEVFAKWGIEWNYD